MLGDYNGGKRVVNTDKIFDELKLIHTENQHIKGKLLYKKVQPKLHGITKQVCEAFCQHCPTCLIQQEAKKPRAGFMPMITHGMNVRGQLDLIDLQSMADGEYKYILNYQDHGIKDVFPVALKSKRVIEIAIALINIFHTTGFVSMPTNVYQTIRKKCLVKKRLRKPGRSVPAA